MLRVGIAFRAALLLGMALVTLRQFGARELWALLLFTGVVLAWSLINVAGTTLAADSALSEGEAMGLVSANGALAGVSGALIGGVLVRYFGYVALPLAAATFIFVGVILSRGLTEPDLV